MHVTSFAVRSLRDRVGGTLSDAVCAAILERAARHSVEVAEGRDGEARVLWSADLPVLGLLVKHDVILCVCELDVYTQRCVEALTPLFACLDRRFGAM